MSWILTDDFDEYWDAAAAFLTGRPVHNTVQLTAAATVRALGSSAYGAAAPLYGWWPDAGRVVAALMHTPPYPVLLTALPGAGARAGARALADAVAARGRKLPGVNAAEPDAMAFAAAWCAVTGTRWQVHRETRLHLLAQLQPPRPGPGGAARIAGRDDAIILREWGAAFAAEVRNLAGFAPGVVQDWIDDKRMILWEAAGSAVAMAGITRTVSGVARVGPVYAPPDQRRRGYAGAATAVVSMLALERGARQVVLFTDRANATSNSLYQRLGYQPVEDRLEVSFETALSS